MATVEELQARVAALEKELEETRAKSTASVQRQKIEQMSSEVVDSNPYRYFSHSEIVLNLS